MFYPSATSVLNVPHIETSQLVCKVSYLADSYTRETCINALNQCCISSLEGRSIAFYLQHLSNDNTTFSKKSFFEKWFFL